MAEHLSGVSRVCPGFGFATLDRRSPYSARVSAICPGCLGLYARARMRVYERAVAVVFFMREKNTLVTLDTLSKRREVIDFKGVEVSRVCLGLWVFCLGLVFSGVLGRVLND